MNEKKTCNTRSIELCIQKQRYHISSQLDLEYLEELALGLDERINAISNSNPKLNKLEATTLSALNLLDELIQENHYNEKSDEEKQSIKTRSNQLIDLLDFSLIGDHPDIKGP